jgi:hypothetical protein
MSPLFPLNLYENEAAVIPDFGCGNYWVYNAAFWVFLIPFFTAVEYSTGFIAFTIIIVVRFSTSLYTNNILNLTPEQYESYPFRI